MKFGAAGEVPVRRTLWKGVILLLSFVVVGESGSTGVSHHLVMLKRKGPLRCGPFCQNNWTLSDSIWMPQGQSSGWLEVA